MFKRYRVRRLMSILDEKGRRISIPQGQVVEVEERNFSLNGQDYVAELRWTNSDGKVLTEPWEEIIWAQYIKDELIAL